MTPIPQTFAGNRDQKGFAFNLVKRQGQIALFSKTKPEWKSGRLCYEVVILKKVPLRRFPNGIVTPEHEAMPSPEEWGMSGWSPYDLKAALIKFGQLAPK